MRSELISAGTVRTVGARSDQRQILPPKRPRKAANRFRIMQRIGQPVNVLGLKLRYAAPARLDLHPPRTPKPKTCDASTSPCGRKPNCIRHPTPCPKPRSPWERPCRAPETGAAPAWSSRPFALPPWAAPAAPASRLATAAEKKAEKADRTHFHQVRLEDVVFFPRFCSSSKFRLIRFPECSENRISANQISATNDSFLAQAVVYGSFSGRIGATARGPDSPVPVRSIFVKF